MMDALVVYAVIAVLTFKASSVNGNLNITQSGSNKIGSTTYILACHITGYSGLATWDRGATGIGQCPVGGCLASTDSRYNFRNDAGAIYVDFLKLTADEDGIVWTCQHGLDPADVFTVEVDTSVGNSPCEGSGKAYTLTIVCSDVLPIVKILIILLLWKYKYCKHTFIRLKPIGKNCRIAVTAQKTLKSATWKIQKKDQQPIPHLKNGYTIDVRRGQLLECMFATDAGVLELSFQNKGDLLHVERDQTITLPTLLKVNHMFPIVKWRFNGRSIQNDDLQFITKVTSSTFGVYDIEMTFKEHKIIIWIQNIIVKESKRDKTDSDESKRDKTDSDESKRDKTDSDESTEDERGPPSRPPIRGPPPIRGVLLLIICFVVDLMCAVLGGAITETNRSTDGYCVEANVIISIVVVSFVVFTIVEIVLIWFLMIKRTGDEKGSRSKEPFIVMTTAETGAISASAGDPKTPKNQNGPNWQPPNN